MGTLKRLIVKSSTNKTMPFFSPSNIQSVTKCNAFISQGTQVPNAKSHKTQKHIYSSLTIITLHIAIIINSRTRTHGVRPPAPAQASAR